MGTSRETNNIWFYLKKRWWKQFFEAFKGPYFWHDSFGQYINRWILCPLLGHRKVHNVSDPGEPPKMYCFNCERIIKKEKNE